MSNNITFFFCSDNGAVERWEGRFDSSGPLRGRKRDLYEGGIRTPMLVSWPGMVAAGAASEAPWYFPDVLPTLAEIAKVGVSTRLDGISMLPVLKGQAHPAPERVMYWEFYERGFQQAVRWKHWKAIRLAHDAPWQLYNLTEDKGETTNIAAEHPEILAKLIAESEKQHAPSAAWPAPIDP